MAQDLFFEQIFVGLKEPKGLVTFLKVLWVAINCFMFLFTGYSLFFIIIPIMKDMCAAPVDVGQTLSEYQAKLISKSMNESESNVNNYSL